MEDISKKLEDLLLLLRSRHGKEENLRIDSIPTSLQLPESPDFNRPDPKPNYVINASADVTKASSSLPNRTIKCHRRISLEEIEERRLKGLCLFCEESETPDHYLLHKNSGILMIDCDEDQSCDDEELVEMEVATESNGIEVNKQRQFQVPVSDSDILGNIELREEKSVLKNLEDVVLNKNLEQGWVQRNVNKRSEVDFDVERDQKVTSNTKFGSTHQMLDKMSQRKERLGIKKKRKGFKSWMFKYKRGYKKLHAFTFSKNMRMVVSQQIEMVETSSDLLLLSGNDSLAESAIGSKLETDLSNQERSELCTENKENEVEVDVGIQEQVENHSMDSVPEASWIPHMCSFLKHQLTNGGRKTFLKTWRFKFKDTAQPRELIQEKLCVHEANETINQLMLPMHLGSHILHQEKKPTPCVNLETELSLEIEVMQEDAQHVLLAFLHLNAIETRYAIGERDEMSEVARDVSKRSMLCLTFGIRESNAGEEQEIVYEQIIMVNEWLHQISLVLQQVMRSKKIKFPKRWMFKYKYGKEDIQRLQIQLRYKSWLEFDHWLGYNLIVAYLGNKKTWTKLRVREHDNLTWKEDARDESRSRSRMKLGDVMITCKNLLDTSYDTNVEIVAWSKRPRHSEISCEVDAFGDEESSKIQTRGKLEQFGGLCKELTDIDVSLASFYVRLRQTSFVAHQVRRNKKSRPSKRWWFKYKSHCYKKNRCLPDNFILYKP